MTLRSQMLSGGYVPGCEENSLMFSEHILILYHIKEEK